MSQWLRKYNLIVGGLGGTGIQLTGAEIQFKVEKNNTSEQNKMNLKIYNLSQSNRDSISIKDTVVYFQVGYTELKTLFAGTVVAVKVEKEDTNFIVEIECGDGNLQLRESVTSRSFKSGATVRQVVTSLVDDLNTVGTDKISIKELNGDALDDTYQNGIAISGRTKNALDNVLKGKNLQWCINNLKFEVNPVYKPNKEDAVYLSAATGMIAVPTFQNQDSDKMIDSAGVNTLNGVKARCLLNPNIEPAKRIIIESLGQSKTYMVQKVTHEGDFWANKWETYIEAIDVN